MTKEDELLIAAADDKKIQSENRYILTHTGFLDMRSQSVLRGVYGSSCRFYGGYDDAERCIGAFVPDYCSENDLKEELSVLRVNIPKGSKKLTHRDYLGSILGLGLDRSVMGDILVLEDGADIVILSSIADFLLMNYSKAGRNNLSCEVLPIDALRAGDIKTTERSDSVASLRLDNMVASAFNLARGKAQDAVRSGLVFVNGVQTEKPDKDVSEGDKIVLRGSGKAVLKEIGGTTRKDRLFIKWTKYI